MTVSLALDVAEVVYRKGTVRDLAVALEIHKGVITVPQLKAVLPGDMVLQANAAAAPPPAPPSPAAAGQARGSCCTGEWRTGEWRTGKRRDQPGRTQAARHARLARDRYLGRAGGQAPEARPQGQAHLDGQRRADRRSRGRPRRPARHRQRRRHLRGAADRDGHPADRSLRPRRLHAAGTARTGGCADRADLECRDVRGHARSRPRRQPSFRRRRRRPTRPRRSSA